MPYSSYAWQNSAKWSKHWKGAEEKLPEVTSVCVSEEESVEPKGDGHSVVNGELLGMFD